MPSMWEQMFGGDGGENRAERRARERDTKRMMRRADRARQRRLKAEAKQAEAERRRKPDGTYWNGLPTQAVRGTAVVADSPAVAYWARREGIIGERIPVVRVDLDGVNYGGGVTYLDDRDGSGWRKVTEGHGGPAYGHRDVSIEPDSFEVPHGQE